MSDIIDKTYAFLDTLDNSSLIKNLTKYKNRLLKNKKLLELIESVREETNLDDLISKRKLLYQNSDYKNYMKYYNELSLIILKINEKYLAYTNTRKCHYER